MQLKSITQILSAELEFLELENLNKKFETFLRLVIMDFSES